KNGNQAAAADATITEKTGAGTLKKLGKGADLDAVLNGRLFEKDSVSTGTDGAMTLTFPGGNKLALQPNTTVIIRRGGATGAELGVVVTSGSVRVESPGTTNHLVVGTPFGMTEVGTSPIVVEIDLSKGLSVLVGDVSIQSSTGIVTINAGNAFQVDGLVVPIGQRPTEPLDVPPVDVTYVPRKADLIADPKYVQIRHVGVDKWTFAQAHDALGAGEAVRTQKGKATQVKFDDGAVVTLSPNAEMHLDESAASGTNRKAKYAITAGAADLHLTRKDGVETDHEITVAGLGVNVKPGDREAEVDVRMMAGGAAELAVRFGRVKLSDGTEVQAGSAVTLKEGKIVSEPRPVVPTNVELRAGTTSVVNYQNGVPPVAFDWHADNSGDASGVYQITVSSDKAFNDVLFSETVRNDGFVYDKFKPGRFYWRVKANGETKEGSMVLQRGGENDCSNCKRVNIINNTGEKTVVYFQQALPALTFQWNEVAGATQYRLKIFDDGAFDKPRVEATSAETKLAFQTGALEDGKYFWLVAALDASGKAVGPSPKTNGLEIAYDNVITDIVIRSPKNGQRVSGNRVSTNGEVALGTRLYINGKQAGTDSKGRFKDTVALDGGQRTLVYRSQASDGVQRFYVREVKR
ncbi:MAG: FecR domain-containing protein, partial [Clostridia bacterium]|nr:FecR domain-containing protein [Deltaproteobacteria bacterium]